MATLRPQPAVPASVRKLPSPRPADRAATPAESNDAALTAPPTRHDWPDTASPGPKRSSTVTPTAPAQYKVQFTVSGETYEKLRRAQDLLRHTIPNGNPGAIFDRALTLLLAELEKTKLAAATRPRVARPAAPGSRQRTRRRSSERCGSEMAGNARSWAGPAGARNAGSWSITTSCPMRTVVPRRRIISSSAVGRTTPMRPGCILVRCGCGRGQLPIGSSQLGPDRVGVRSRSRATRRLHGPAQTRV